MTICGSNDLGQFVAIIAQWRSFLLVSVARQKRVYCLPCAFARYCVPALYVALMF
jgi:hypothetical protein